MSKITSKIISLVLAVAVIVGVFCMPAHAATCGGGGTQTIHATTSAHWGYPGSESITLKQNKQTYTYRTWGLFKGWYDKTGSGYPVYYVTVYNNTTRRTEYSNKKFSGSSLKLNLKTYSDYTITVRHDSNATWLNNDCNWSGSGWWWVSSSHKVDSLW